MPDEEREQFQIDFEDIGPNLTPGPDDVLIRVLLYNCGWCDDWNARAAVQISACNSDRESVDEWFSQIVRGHLETHEMEMDSGDLDAELARIVGQ